MAQYMFVHVSEHTMVILSDLTNVTYITRTFKTLSLAFSRILILLVLSRYCLSNDEVEIGVKSYGNEYTRSRPFA